MTTEKPINQRIREKIEIQLGKLMLERIEHFEDLAELRARNQELATKVQELESTEPQ